MAFSISTRDIPPVRSYADAVRVWGKSKPWRGEKDLHAPRPLLASRRRNMTVRRCDDDAIVFSLYDTDVVTYTPDNKVSLQGWHSKSTDVFANCLTPTRVHTSFNNSNGRLVFVGESCWGGVGYLMPDNATKSMTLATSDGLTWEPVTPTAPFETYVIDRARAREALKKHGFYDFVGWARAAVKMKAMAWESYPHIPTNEWVNMLNDRERWSDLLVRGIVRGVGDNIGGLMQELRVRVYKQEGVVEKVEVPTIVGMKAWRTINRNNWIYGR